MAALTVFYPDADRVTGHATAAITGGQTVKVSASRADGENIKVAPAGASDVVFGVAGHDAAVGEKVTVVRCGVVNLTASAAITAGQRVQAAANGAVAPLSSGFAIGIAVDDIAANATGAVALYC